MKKIWSRHGALLPQASSRLSDLHSPESQPAVKRRRTRYASADSAQNENSITRLGAPNHVLGRFDLCLYDPSRRGERAKRSRSPVRVLRCYKTDRCAEIGTRRI